MCVCVFCLYFCVYEHFSSFTLISIGWIVWLAVEFGFIWSFNFSFKIALNHCSKRICPFAINELFIPFVMCVSVACLSVSISFCLYLSLLVFVSLWCTTTVAMSSFYIKKRFICFSQKCHAILCLVIGISQPKNVPTFCVN